LFDEPGGPKKTRPRSHHPMSALDSRRFEREVKDLPPAPTPSCRTRHFIRDCAARSTEVVRYIDARKGRWGGRADCRAFAVRPQTYYDATARHECATNCATKSSSPRSCACTSPTATVSTARRRSGSNCTAKGIDVANCTVRRLMRAEGLSGARPRSRVQGHDRR